jgi:hypothetical protein
MFASGPGYDKPTGPTARPSTARSGPIPFPALEGGANSGRTNPGTPPASSGTTAVLTADPGLAATPPLAVAGRWYLAPMAAIVAIAVGLLLYEFLKQPVPPGVDPGHWLSIAYSYVGLPTAPDPADRPFFYSPLLFPFLGGLVLLTGNPMMAATILAAALLGTYGLTVMHLARRFLVSGPLQVLLVGLALFSGTTYRMMFWGGYPNFLGFILATEAIVFFLLFVRGHRTVDAGLFFAAVGLTFLAHELTFFVLLSVLAASTFFLLYFRKLSIRFLLDRRTLVGGFGVVALVLGYGELTKLSGIRHASYFFGNPSAYHVDHIGEIFIPLAGSPMYFPAGHAVVLAPFVAVVLLLAVPVVSLLVLSGIRRRWPDRIDVRLLVAVGWLSAAATMPAVGYLLHVQTDYPRFLFFLPLPFTLLLMVSLERVVARPLLAGGHPTYIPAHATLPAGRPVVARLRRRQSAREPVALAAVTVIIFLVFAGVTWPIAQKSESGGAKVAHDPAFVAATNWLAHQPGAGNVLSPSTAARWTEALTQRQTFTNGPIWLLFDPFQIVDSEEAYWAFNSQYTVSNGQVVLSYSGFGTSLYSQAPMYTANDAGIPFPVFRILPGSIALNASTGTTYGLYPVQGGPSLAVDSVGPGHGTIVYTTTMGTITETAQPTDGGAAVLSFQVQPFVGAHVRSIVLVLAGPPTKVPMLARDSITNLSATPHGLNWSVTGQLGEYPYPAVLRTQISFSQSSSFGTYGSYGGAKGYRAEFRNPNGSAPFTVSISAKTAGTSNPTTAFPTTFATTDFLQAHNIHYLLWPNATTTPSQVLYYESTFGFQVVYANAEWLVLRV